ncbi:hypothetical protein IWT140_01721 [Secundilactobacillus pentosiphilus]|uniref:Uncharacterized protein n=1 Tax=Secundilactobacillus pentosiphilus TaxID=1714682 RepID=A0A1Z5IQN3_9LACO|nr:hypothetical protein [Secundilactobacillus pentosiphilus]GAX04084.1 hypothetical protein IWT140_01721 [Secundilactobacillus pentosiphilus]
MNKLSEAVKKWLAVAEDDINGEVAHDASWAETAKREWEQGITATGNDTLAVSAWDMYSKAVNQGFTADQAFEIAMKRVGL